MSILARGYAIALHVPTGRALRSAGEASVGDALEVRLSQGRVLAEVTRVDDAAAVSDPDRSTPEESS